MDEKNYGMTPPPEEKKRTPNYIEDGAMVLPALSYGCEAWTLTKAHENKINVIQAAIERRLVGLNLRCQRMLELHNRDIREMSGVRDMLQYALRRKHDWAGHLARREDERWSLAVQLWIPREKIRPLGRPPIRWADTLRATNSQTIREHWTTIAKNRDRWKYSWDPHATTRRIE